MNLWFTQVLPYLLLTLYHIQFDHSVPATADNYYQEATDQPPKLYHPPGVPYSPVHFNEYPLNPDYAEFSLEEIILNNPEAQTRETELIGCEGTWITVPPLLFRNKYNYLPVYLVPMTPPLTPRPDRPQEPEAPGESTSTQIFGVLYITLMGLINSMMPYSGPWAILRKSLSYIVKLIPILWWALLSGPAGCPPASSPECQKSIQWWVLENWWAGSPWSRGKGPPQDRDQLYNI
ncbi:hypothetical protein DSO57_1022739 [Entomophthora muscae]|uniref:Uncharacterized protein n=1 Tax=Entomophthora muscae TaxID=34485 RepID=A0ACC2RU70_9FUNG|nr:hypothetical protein DSO57_1022739 [Entomophthora muscae]